MSDSKVVSVRLKRRELASLRVDAAARGVPVSVLIRERVAERIAERVAPPCTCTPVLKDWPYRDSGDPTRKWHPWPLPIDTYRAHFGDCPLPDEYVGTRLEAR